MTITWAPMPRYEGIYEISSDGLVRNVKSGRETYGSPMNRGYLLVRLYRDGIGRSFRVHRLVLEAFVGACPSGQEARHLNGTKSDNRLVNLQWGTAKQNSADRRAHGTYRGSFVGKSYQDNPQGKLSLGDVICLEGLSLAFKQSDLATIWGVSQSTVSKAIKRHRANANLRHEARLSR